MRWFWIDRFEKFVSGVEASSIKSVTRAEEALDHYLPGYEHYPHSLIIEGMAQTGGILISQLDDFKSRIVLAKVSKAHFYELTGPGDQLKLTATLVSRSSDGAICEGRVEVSGKLQAELELTFASLDESFGAESFFIPGDFCRVLRSLKLFDVGVNPDGSPIHIPQHMLDDEAAQLDDASP